MGTQKRLDQPLGIDKYPKKGDFPFY